MQIFGRLASYSFGKADVVRKAISKKKPEVIAKQRQDFLCGCKENGIEESKAAELFDELVSFAGYAFNKSHAAAYSVIAYRTAYLKAHYPSEFFAALMTSEMNNRTKLSEYILEASRLGIKLLPPSINESEVNFTEDSGNIRYGLSALKNVGIGFVTRMLDERNRGGKFCSFTDFCDRMYGRDLNKKQVETLIKAGAFDSMGIFRSRLLEKYSDILDRISDKKKEAVTGQMSLFSTEEANSDEHISFPDVPEFPLRVLLNLEHEASGMYFSGHLTDEYSESEKDIGSVPITSVLSSFDGENDENESSATAEFSDGQSVALIGVIRNVNVKISKKGDKFAFVRLEDRTGEIELLVFSQTYKEYAPLLTNESVIAVYGKISAGDEEAPKLIVSAVAPLKPNGRHVSGVSPFEALTSKSGSRERYNSAQSRQAPPSSAPETAKITFPEEKRKLYLRVRSIESDEAKNAISVIKATPGSVPVIFYDSQKGKYVSRADLRFYPSEKALAMLKRLLGEENVVMKN